MRDQGPHDDGARHAFFDHTGDFGVDVHGPSRAAVAVGFARAFLDLLTDAAGTVQPRSAREVAVEGLDAADALVAFGNELLFLFESEGFLAARFEPAVVEEDAIAGTLRGEVYDPARHPIARPIKAVTHHAADVSPAPEGGYRARIVFDL